MKITPLPAVRALLLDGLLPEYSLDPVLVVLRDIPPSAGQLVVTCWGRSWSASWNAMGQQTVAQFVAHSPPEYLVEKLSRDNLRDSEEKYLGRIVAATQAGVQAWLRQEAP